MQGVFITLGAGLLALLAVAVLVALFEYLRSVNRVASLPEPQPARAVSIDLDLNHIDAAQPATSAPGDQQQRQATVDQALARMAQPGSGAGTDTAWIETRPTVLTGTAETTR